MKIIIYSGSYNVNALGSTRSIDRMLTKSLVHKGHQVVWVGRGNVKSPLCKYHNLGHENFRELFGRISNKIRRLFFNITPNDIALKEFIKYDLLMAKKINSGSIIVDRDTIIIGRNGMSLFSFNEVKRRGGHTILHSQWMHPRSQQRYLESEFSRLNMAINPIPEKRIVRQEKEIEVVDQIWCISSLVEESYIENKILREKLITCPLGVDFDLYSSIDGKNRNPNEFNILFVGNINPEKGVSILFEAVLRMKNYNETINIVLNGSVPEYFQSIFSSYVLKLNNAGISIKITPGNPLDNYSKSSILVLPSVHESFGLVVLEAMASGLPVIVSDNVGAKDCVTHNVNGFIFKKGDDKSLSSFLKMFLDDKTLHIRMAKKSRKLAKRYRWEVITDRLVSRLGDYKAKK